MHTNMVNTVDVIIPSTPEIPGLVLRGFRGAEDFPKMVAVIQGSKTADGIERSDTVEVITNNYAHLHNSNPDKDMLFAEINDNVVAYSRVWWDIDGDKQFIGSQVAFVLPEWRHQGIGSALLRFNEQHLRQIATQLKECGEIPADTACLFDSFISDTAKDNQALLERHGYQIVRCAYDMLRPDLEDIPRLPLPPGVEVRPVQTEHIRTIWEASNEAFKDHWGSIPDPWEEYERMQQDPDFDPSLWRVAWHNDQIAGMVLSYIDKKYNEEYRRKRGYTENICVRRPWRKQGLASALIALSLEAIKERGMAEAALGVDAENISGALHLYEKMGFQVAKKNIVYRKPFGG